MTISRKARTVGPFKILHELAGDFSSIIASDLSSILDDIYDTTTNGVMTHATAPVAALDQNLLYDLAHARNRAIDLAYELACHVDLARVSEPDVDRVHDGIADLSFALKRIFDHSHGDKALFGAIPQLERVLDCDLDFAKRTHSLLISLSGPSHRAAVVSRAAWHVMGFTARLLPAECRRTKAEEFACELYDLASTGVSRRQQLSHALRVLLHISLLRRALSSSRRRAMERG